MIILKTENEIREKLEEITKDERLGYKTATIVENAPLALIQLSLETKRDVLKWVLDKN